MERPGAGMRIGTAGWGIPKEHAAAFPAKGSHLERYAAVFNAVEINSSFYRPHRRSTYERWAASVPSDFQFAVKVPKSITHQQRLRDVEGSLENFLSEVSGLGSKLGSLLVQLPPSFAFEAGVTDELLRELMSRVAGAIALEPRHRSWFTLEAEHLLDELRMARVAADPAVVLSASVPGGWSNLVYCRLHGSPRIYYSNYAAAALDAVAERLRTSDASSDAETWCIFDNTAAFFAVRKALDTKSLLQPILARPA